MKKELMELLACPYDKLPLELQVFEQTGEEIRSGIILCTKCSRWYPIKDTVPELLPDDQRKAEIEKAFLKEWASKLTPEILRLGKPFNVAEDLPPGVSIQR